jgi:Flp pilus assembly protein TadG
MRQLLSKPSELHGPRRARGLATVEFVIAMPLLLFLMFATAEFGRAFFHYATLSNSVRDAARFVSENAINGTTGVVEITATDITRAKNLAIYGNVFGAGQAVLPAFVPSHLQVIDAGGDNVRVTATYPYQSMLGATLPGFGTTGASTPLNFNLQIAVTMRAIS